MTNRYGNYLTTRAEDMAAHDACPPELRFLVNYSVTSYASKPLLRDYRKLLRKGWSLPEIVRAFTLGMAEDDRKHTLKAYGPTHPEAEPAQRRPRKARA